MACPWHAIARSIEVAYGDFDGTAHGSMARRDSYSLAMNVACETHSAEQTIAVGRRFGALLRPEDVAALFGPMGAGKTTFVRGVAEALGVDPALVASPTYVVMHDYPGERLGLIHVDAYRLSGADEVDSLGWDRAMRGECAMVIEWPERIAGALDDKVIARVTITPTGDASRRIEFDLPETWRVREGAANLAQTLDVMCPVTGRPVPADSPTWPFVDERAKLADLHRWFSGQYMLSRPIDPSDEEEVS